MTLQSVAVNMRCILNNERLKSVLILLGWQIYFSIKERKSYFFYFKPKNKSLCGKQIKKTHIFDNSQV